jgi:hypothetical protein
MNRDDKNKDQNKKNDQNKKAPDITPTGQRKIVDEESIKQGKVGGIPSQKSGSRGAADVQDGGTDIGSSAGSH